MGESKRRQKQDPNYGKQPLLSDMGVMFRLKQSNNPNSVALITAVQPDSSKVKLIKGLNPDFPDWAFARIDYEATSTLGVKGIFHVLLPTEGNLTDAEYQQIIDDIRFGIEPLVLTGESALFIPKAGYRLRGRIEPFMLASSHPQLSDIIEQTEEDRLRMAYELVKCNS